MDKDRKKPIPTKAAVKQTNIFDIPESIIPPDKRLFTPHWGNRPPALPPVITIQGKLVLTTGNLLVIVSRPGTGKTSVCEALVAGLANPNCDSLGFKISLSKPRDKVLYIDTEQEKIDHWDSWARTYARAGIKEPNINHRIIFESFKAVAFADRKNTVVQLLNDNPDIGLIIFDGAGDFVKDSNSIADTNDFIEWINSFNPRISKVVTIHTNPRDDKPRGTIGSELCRRGYSVFLLRKIEDGLVREITTSFEFGKVRRDEDQIELFFKYSKDLKRFVSADYTPKKQIVNEKDAQYRDMAVEIFTGHSVCSAKFIIGKIAKLDKKSPEASKQIFYRHFANKVVKNTATGYELQISNNEVTIE